MIRVYSCNYKITIPNLLKNSSNNKIIISVILKLIKIFCFPIYFKILSFINRKLLTKFIKLLEEIAHAMYIILPS
jgi:hypothetical protein